MDRGERTLEESLLVLGNLLQEEDWGVCLHLLMPDCNQTPQSVQEKERNFPPKKYGEIHHGAMPREGVATSTLSSAVRMKGGTPLQSQRSLLNDTHQKPASECIFTSTLKYSFSL